jgi:CTP synthase
MQVMCIEFARNVLQYEDANSSEFAANTEHAVIDLMENQRGVSARGGTMRLGLYDCDLQEGSKAQLAYGTKQIAERHRHRFEFNNEFRRAFEANGMRFSGINQALNLVEVAEVVDHPFMVGSQYHPEFTSRPNRPHPLFQAFVESSIAMRADAPTVRLLPSVVDRPADPTADPTVLS